MSQGPDNGRMASLEGWAEKQRRRLDEEERRRGYQAELARVTARARQATAQPSSLRGGAAIPVVVTRPSDLPADRAAGFGDLMAGLREHRWADPLVSQCDEPRFVVPQAIDIARRHRPEAPWLLYMEDDVILGPDFGLLPHLLEEAAERFPGTGVVSFFSAAFIEPGWSTLPLQRFGWLQCLALRNTAHLASCRPFVDDLARERGAIPRPGHQTRAADRTRPTPPSDIALGRFLATKYDTFALWCPSLVQHADLSSVFPGAQLKRISRSYEHAYGQARAAGQTPAPSEPGRDQTDRQQDQGERQRR